MIDVFWNKSLCTALTLSAGVAVGSLALTSAPHVAHAKDCTVTKKADDMEDADVDALYECMREKLVKAYGKAGEAIGKDYTTWKAASTRPAAPGVHGSRFLMTYVNETGHAEYVKYGEEGVKMPAGSVIAKESFKINKKGKARVGPLFVMTKLEAGKAAKYGDWLYSALKPNGKVMKVSQKFCHTCHAAFEGQDALGYPAEEVRLK